MKHPLLANNPGEKQILLGNEAIVRGALEAGVNVVTCYPGTPSSEVPDTFYRLAPSGRFRMEYSVNEKVALEVGAGASLAGALTLVTMKHVGVNVAADPLFTLAYTGSPGGLVLLSADDPGCHSSQDEQDNRYYARMAGLPCYEPATAQEAKDMTRDALLLSRKFEQPVLLRTTTRVNHLRGSVVYGPLPEPAPHKPYQRNPMRFVPVPAVARIRHGVQLANLAKIQAEIEISPWNKISGTGRTGVIASGISRSYLHDVLLEPEFEGKLKVLDLGITWPFPEKLVQSFLKDLDQVLVLEELEPLVENEVRLIAQKQHLSLKISGKAPGLSPDLSPNLSPNLSREGEYSTRIVRRALAQFLNIELDAHALDHAVPRNLPNRPPILCAGCSHRAIYYAINQVFGRDTVYSSDIGCYTLGIASPLNMADFLYCMGSSISAGSGFAAASGKTTVGFIGDSTFFHSGVTGLLNAVFNRHNILLVILDNGTTAMTGHQPNPGVVAEILGDHSVHIDIESVVKGCGVTQVAKVRPYNLRGSMQVLEQMKAMSGVRVLIVEEPCVLYARRTLKKTRTQYAYVHEQGQELELCHENLGCPAFGKHDGDVFIDPEMCAGCMVCLQITPKIKARKKEA